MDDKNNWRKIIEARELEEKHERERQLEEGRKAWAKLQAEFKRVEENEKELNQ